MAIESIPYIGEIFALMAPLAWSFAIILFRKTGELVPPVALNLFKNVLAMVLFMMTSLFLGDGIFRDVENKDYSMLVISGVLGIGVADTLLFAALNRLGAGLWSIVNTAYSPTIIILSVIILNEVLTPIQVGGVFSILLAVLIITRMKDKNGTISKKDLLVGIFIGLGAIISQAVSIVMIKPLLEESPLFWANQWRLLGGLISMIAILPFMKERKTYLKALRNTKALKIMLPAAFLGTYVSLIFWLGGMKYTQASTASALNQSATLFTFILAAILLKEPVTKHKIIGLILGAIGVLLVTFGK